MRQLSGDLEYTQFGGTGREDVPPVDDLGVREVDRLPDRRDAAVPA